MKTINEEIRIREETIRKLRLDKNPSLLMSLRTAVQYFLEYKFMDAYFALLNLLYNDDKDLHNKVLKKLNFTLYAEASFDIYNPRFFIEEDSVRPIAEELQFQYMSAHPLFLNPNEECTGCKKEFDDLKNTFGNQHLLFYRAFISVWNNRQNSELAQNSISLLLSENEKAQMKGLEKLNLDSKHQRLLLPYAKEIGIFLKAAYNAYKESMPQPVVEEKIETSQQPVQNSTKSNLVLAAQKELNSAFAPLAAIWDKVPAEAAPVPKPNNACKHPSNQKTHIKPTKCSLIKEYSVSPELSKFLDNKSAMSCNIPNAAEFWEFMAKLRDVGLNLNLLVDKLPYLLAVLTAHEDLENATNALNHAYQKHEEANANFSEHEISTVQTFVSAGKVYTDAINVYTSAFENFVKQRDAFENAVAKS